MSDYDLIRKTIARNNLALDDRRFEDCIATYAPDGSIAGHTGHAAIREFMLGQDLAIRPELQRRHVNTNIAIELNGDEAEAVSDLLVYDKVAAGHGAGASAVITTASRASPTARAVHPPQPRVPLSIGGKAGRTV